MVYNKYSLKVNFYYSVIYSFTKYLLSPYKGLANVLVTVKDRSINKMGTILVFMDLTARKSDKYRL